MVYREGRSSYGYCWIEGDGVTFWVYVMDGRSTVRIHLFQMQSANLTGIADYCDAGPN